MDNRSIWIHKNNSKIVKKKFKEKETDILIIGGGITGINLAYFLKDSKYDITLIDKSDIGMGVTSKSTAKITYLQSDIYQKLYKYHNYSTAKKYFDSQITAINLIVDIINKNNINCDLINCDSVIFTSFNDGIKKIENEKMLLESFGVFVKDVKNKKIKRGIKVKNTYSFNPIKYLYHLKKIIEKNVNVIENIVAKNIIKNDKDYLIETDCGNIKAKIVVVACHYPFFIIPGLFPLKTYIKREYVNAAKIANPQKYTAINIDKDLHSVRFYDDYLIYGSNNHRLTSKIDYKKNYYKSKSDFKKYFKIEPEYTWMNQDIMSNDLLPFVGELKNNLYVSLGYNAWGMTNGVLAAKIISDSITKTDNQFSNFFNPNRLNWMLIFNFFIGSFHYLKAYVIALFKKNNPRYVKINGIFYGIYVDKDGKEHVVKLLCPHMKCSLVFNQEEETWDCPCHGSRFNIDGVLIEGPSKDNI